MGEVNRIKRSAGLAFLAVAMLGAGPVQQDRIPPLDEQQQARLNMAVAHAVARDDAFAALVEHLEKWPSPAEIDLDAEPLRRRVEWAEVVVGPSELRGELLLLEGTLAMRTPVEINWSNILLEEWFVESGSQMVIAFVPAGEIEPSLGGRVRVVGRLYTTLTETARDGVERTWPAIVGVSLASSGVATGESWGIETIVLAGVVIFGAAIFLLLRRAQRRSGGGDTAQALSALRRDADEEDAEAELPADPAEALGALRQSSESRKDQDA